MIEEIIYTSAPKGLKQGSRGFCTVVSTAGMGVNLAERLESMSGYRHAFPLNDPQASLNPVCFTFVTTRMAGQKLHVISRVADAGQDYSGRTNKLAHHIVVDDTSVLPAGPARVLAEPDSVATSWDGTVATKPPRRLPVPRLPAKVDLVAWKSATGDHGWAGYVAEQLLGSRAPVNIIFKAGTDTLALVTEVFDLIPYPQRWEVTFSTYFTRLLAGTECQLRFYLDGTAEATSIRNDARSIKVDLAAALPPAVGGALVEAARTGILQFQQAKAIPKSSPATKAKSPQSSVTDAELEQLLATDEPVASKVTPVKSGDGTVASTLRRVGSAPPPVSRLHQAFEKEQNSSGIWIIGLLVALLLCAVGVGIFMVWKPVSEYVANAQSEKDTTENGATTPAPSVATPPKPEADESAVATTELNHQSGASLKDDPPQSPMVAETSDIPPKTDQTQPVARFSDKKALDGIRDSTSPGEQLMLSLESQTPEIPVYIESLASFAVDLKSPHFTVASEPSMTEAKWKVRMADQPVGSFTVTVGDGEMPAKLRWDWADAKIATLPATSPLQLATRRLRNTKIEFSYKGRSPAENDDLSIPVGLRDWTRFRYSGTTASKKPQFFLNVRENRAEIAPSEQQSAELIFESNSLDEIDLSPVAGFNSILDALNVTLTASKAKPGKDAVGRVWSLGLMTKDAPPEDTVKFGEYVIEQQGDSGLYRLYFRWTRPSSDANCKLLQWAPMRLKAGSETCIVFPKRPIKLEQVQLEPLEKNDQTTVDANLESPFLIRMDKETKLTTRIVFSHWKQSTPVTVTKDSEPHSWEPPGRQSDAKVKSGSTEFPLESEITLGPKVDPSQGTNLGTCTLIVEAQPDLGRRSPFAIKVYAIPNYNRLSPNAKATGDEKWLPWDFPSVLDDKLWKKDNQNEKYMFDAAEYEQKAVKFNQYILGVRKDVPSDQRVTEYQRLTQFAKSEKVDGTETLLIDVHEKLDRAIGKFKFGLEKSKAELSGRSELTQGQVDRLIEARNSAKMLMEEQLKKVEELRKMYSATSIAENQKLVASVLKQLGEVRLDYKFSIPLKNDAEEVELILYSTLLGDQQ